MAPANAARLRNNTRACEEREYGQRGCQRTPTVMTTGRAHERSYIIYSSDVSVVENKLNRQTATWTRNQVLRFECLIILLVLQPQKSAKRVALSAKRVVLSAKHVALSANAALIVSARRRSAAARAIIRTPTTDIATPKAVDAARRRRKKVEINFHGPFSLALPRT